MIDQPKTNSQIARTRRRRELVTKLKAEWQRKGEPDARAFLADHDSVRGDRSLAIEVAYEEYCLRRDQGEEVDVEEFCASFPSIHRSLLRQLEVDEYVRSQPELLNSQMDVEWPRPGDRLFGFRVVEEIGRGAFARVYLCSQQQLGNRQVVVKVAYRGALEAETMGGLNHPNIMAVYSVQEESESKVSGICMPFVGRSTLCDVIDVAFGRPKPPYRAALILEAASSLVRRGDVYQDVTPPLHIRPRSEYTTGVLQIALQLARALSHAHQRSVLHGDLKPTNIVMSLSGVPLIVDFNLSHSGRSHTLITGGTLPYMAPEQVRSLLLGVDDEDCIDQRGDVYSFGAILYEMLSGETPFGPRQVGGKAMEAAGKLLDAQTAGPISLIDQPTRPGTELDRLVRRCLAYDPGNRPDNMDIVVHELERQLSVTRSISRYTRRHRRGFLAAGMAAGMAMAGGLAVFASRPPLGERLLRSAEDYYHDGRYHDALDVLNQAVLYDADNPELFYARGICAIQLYLADGFLGWLDAALRDLSIASRQTSNRNVELARAYCITKKGEFRAAQRAYADLLDDQPNDAQCHSNSAYVISKVATLGGTGQDFAIEMLRAAATHAEMAQRLRPQLWQPHFLLATIDLELYRKTEGEHIPRDGLEAARLAVQLKSDHPAILFFAAKITGVVAMHDKSNSLEEESFEYLLDGSQTRAPYNGEGTTA